MSFPQSRKVRQALQAFPAVAAADAGAYPFGPADGKPLRRRSGLPSLWGDFLQVLAKVPNLVLYKTYAARGKPIVGGRALDLSRTLGVPYFTNTQKLLSYLRKTSLEYDAIVLCGAGDVVSGEFLRQAPFVTFD